MLESRVERERNGVGKPVWERGVNDGKGAVLEAASS